MFSDDKKKKNDKSVFYDNLKDLNYKDSWLHNSVELAALGGIMTGAGIMMTRGDFNEAGPGVKRAIGIMGKGVEKSLKKSGLTGTKFGWQVASRLYGNLSRMTPQADNMERVLPGSPMYDGIIEKFNNDIQNDPATKKQLAKKVDELSTAENGLNYNMHKLYGDPLYKTNDDRRRELFEQVKHEELMKRLGYDPKDNAPKKKGKWFGNNGDNGPVINSKQIGRDMVSNGLAGIAFGAGITGIHALDRWSGNKDNQKNLENTFTLAGSFLPKDKDDKKDNKNMRKHAALNPKLTEGFKNIGMKFPEAVMGGLGYTAVSLGASKAFGSDPRKGSTGAVPPSAQNLDNKDGNNQNSPHVIIELRQQGQHGHKKKQEATLKVASFDGGLAGLALRKGNN